LNLLAEVALKFFKFVTKLDVFINKSITINAFVDVMSKSSLDGEMEKLLRLRFPKEK